MLTHISTEKVIRKKMWANTVVEVYFSKGSTKLLTVQKLFVSLSLDFIGNIYW